MKFTLGVLVGLAAAWAALAIWQRVPTLEEIVWEPDADERFTPPRQVVRTSDLLPQKGGMP